jgi:uncharacterized protein involved in exopolysaccharide biosynthesis
VAIAAIHLEASLAERLQSLRRYQRSALIVLAIGVAITLALALFWPPTYRSSATILIEQQEIPQDFVRTMISSYADQRIQTISQRVMTSQNLMRIVERYNLYPWQRRTQAREAIVERMRDDIKMRLISANVVDPRSGRPIQATIAFTVSYDSRSPELALKVANELTSLYLEENLALRTAAARQSATFLGDASGKLAEDIQALSKQISDFKAKHPEGTPEFSQSNFAMLDRTELELRDARARLGIVEQQKIALDAQFQQMSPTSQMYSETGQRIMTPADRLKMRKADLADLTARYGTKHPDVLKAQREIAGLETQVAADGSANDLMRKLDDAKAKLADVRGRYSADHPDVLRLSRMVGDIEQQLTTLPATERVRQARTNPDNPAYIQVKSQLDTLEKERTLTERRVDDLQRRLSSLQVKVAAAPEVEREYRRLTRDYDNAQTKYQEVRLKQREAESSQNLETERKGEKFTLIEPPLPPEAPISPNRPVLLLLGLLASLGLGVGVALVRDALDPSVRGVYDLTRLVEVAPLATIPRIQTAAEALAPVRGRRHRWLIIAGVAFSVLVLIHVFVRPLDSIVMSLAKRVGL